jgi:2,3-bisphosphoglycerate-dependent phosphoglycerate mutase
MQLYVIRHAQSANNKLYDETGSWIGRDVDPDLTEVGHRQAQCLAAHLAWANGEMPPRDDANRQGFGFTHLYTSPMLRAILTGTYLAGSLRLPLTVWEDWHEVGGAIAIRENGEREGQPGATRSDLTSRFPELVLPETLSADGWWNRPAESIEEQLERAQRLVRDLAARHGKTADRVAVISHGGFYNFFLTALLNTTPGDGFWFNLNNTGLTRLDFREEGIALTYANRLEHLPAELIT